MNQQIQDFFKSDAFAVVGASTNRDKFGNKVLRCYFSHGKKAYPVNPVEEMIEGVSCVKSVSDLPKEVKSISIITPPKVTEKIVVDAIKKGIKNIWMQPGAQSDVAVKSCIDAGVNVISDGSCILATLGFKEHN